MLATGPRPLAAADVMEDLANVVEVKGEREEAIDMYQSAHEIYGRIGATRDAPASGESFAGSASSARNPPIGPDADGAASHRPNWRWRRSWPRA